MDRETLVAAVLAREWRMFVEVRSATPARCQSAPGNFKAIRGSLFELWSQEMLESYRDDLDAAEAQGRNLLTEKYARMDGLIGPRVDNPLIEDIVEIEKEWQAQLAARYPGLYQRCCRQSPGTTDGSDFEVYLRGELETYGDRTLVLYRYHVTKAMAEGRNLAIDALERLVRRGGYADIRHAEQTLTAGRAEPSVCRP